MASFANMLIVFMAIQIVLSIVYCFFGYKLIRVLMGLYGFFLGGLTCFSLLSANTSLSMLLILIISIVAGIVLAGLVFFLYSVGVFLAGAALGLLVANTALSFVSAQLDPTLMIVIYALAAIVCGILALALRRPFIIIATSFFGAYNVILYGGYLILDRSNLDTYMTQPFSTDLVNQFINQSLNPFYAANQNFVLIGTLILGGIGVIIQFLYTARKVHVGRHRR